MFCFLFSVEDPFETWYDVAHVLKGSQMMHVRKEFLVRNRLFNIRTYAALLKSLF
jgi:hypothetical protein